VVGAEDGVEIKPNTVYVNTPNTDISASSDVSSIRVQGRLLSGEVEVSVKDCGVGMNIEQKARAFDPFYTTRPVGSGLGLGLSLAQGIARQHNAELSLNSQLGIGTTVIYRCHAA